MQPFPNKLHLTSKNCHNLVQCILTAEYSVIEHLARLVYGQMYPQIFLEFL